jgi:hypothetical protein
MLLLLWVQMGRSLCRIDGDAERRGTSDAPIIAQPGGKEKGRLCAACQSVNPVGLRHCKRNSPAAAEAQGKSLNAWAQELLQRAVTG